MALTIVFIILTFVGAGYVLMNEGKANAGYAVVPMALALAGFAFYRKNAETKLLKEKYGCPDNSAKRGVTDSLTVCLRSFLNINRASQLFGGNYRKW